MSERRGDAAVGKNALMGKRLAVFGANNVVAEVTRFAKANGIVLISVGNVPEAEMHKVSEEYKKYQTKILEQQHMDSIKELEQDLQALSINKENRK